MSGLLSGLWGYLAAAGAGLALVVGAYFRGRSDATTRGGLDRAVQRLDTIKQSHEVEDEVDRLGHADVDQRLDRWMRDGSER